MVKVLGLGDNVCDVYLHTNTMYPGGQALNFAANAKKLGADADFMGDFGEDAIADHIKKVIDELGIGRSHCRTYQGENGFARVTLVDGDRVFKGSNKGGVLQQHPLYLDACDLKYASEFDLIHTNNNGFLDGLLPALNKLPGLLSYDFSYRWYEEDRVERVCPYIDFAFVSCSELADEETEELCRKLCAKGTGVVVATRGSKGATVYDGCRFYRQLPHLVKAIDTMGAGDAFATAMLVAVLKRLEEHGRDAWKDAAVRSEILPEALEAAAEFSSQTCLVSGGFGYGTTIPESVHDRIFEGIEV